MQIAAWFTLVGGLLGGLGSAVRAWFAIKEYEDLVQRAQIPNLLKAALRFTIKPSASLHFVGSLAWLVPEAVVALLVTLVRAVWKGPKAAGTWAVSAGKAAGVQVKKDFFGPSSRGPISSATGSRAEP